VKQQEFKQEGKKGRTTPTSGKKRKALKDVDTRGYNQFGG